MIMVQDLILWVVNLVNKYKLFGELSQLKDFLIFLLQLLFQDLVVLYMKLYMDKLIKLNKKNKIKQIKKIKKNR